MIYAFFIIFFLRLDVSNLGYLMFLSKRGDIDSNYYQWKWTFYNSAEVMYR